MAIQKITSGIIQDGAVAAADIVSVSNTAITGNIISSQIAPDQTLNGNVSVTGNTILGDATTDTLNVGAGGLVKNASGNVGIGTSSPAHVLDVSKSANESLVRINGSSSRAYFQSNASSFDIVSETSAGAPNALSLRPSGGAGLLIDSSGNLLVGATSVLQQGFVNIQFDGGSKQGIALKTTSAVSGTTFLYFLNSSGTVQGAVNAPTTSTIAYVTTSDYRLKEDVAPMTGALAKVALLKPVNYKWKIDGADGQGFIAHEIQAIVPDCVTGEKDAVNEDGTIKPQGIDTSFLVATLTAAIQEQQALITQLQADVATLKALSALEIK
jgi:hypothetical protein